MNKYKGNQLDIHEIGRDLFRYIIRLRSSAFGLLRWDAAARPQYRSDPLTVTQCIHVHYIYHMGSNSTLSLLIERIYQLVIQPSSPSIAQQEHPHYIYDPIQHIPATAALFSFHLLRLSAQPGVLPRQISIAIVFRYGVCGMLMTESGEERLLTSSRPRHKSQGRSTRLNLPNIFF